MSLTRTFPCSPEKVRQALEQLKGLGARIEGDAASGTIAGQTPIGRLEGSYAHDGRSLTLTISSWPALIPTQFLEDKLDEMIRRYGGE
jgi:hypothetical protein